MTTPLLSRDEWGARPRKSAPSNINNEGQTAHYGGPSPWGDGPDRSNSAAFRDSTDHNRCASIARAWQAFHMDSRGWTDIAYNSLVCPHGTRYEGRGVGKRSGANGTNSGNARSCATVGIWGDDDPVTDEAKQAFLDEAERFGVSMRWDHSDWKPTACAGNPIREWEAQGWPAPGSVGPTPDTPPVVPPAPRPSGRPVLRKGSKGGHVSHLQRLLHQHGHGGAGVSNFDGVFGPAVERSVRAFQQERGLQVDGIVGNQTWGALEGSQPAPQPTPEPVPVPQPPPAPTAPAFPGIMRRGSRGENVVKVQERLHLHGFGGAGVSNFDGDFGPAVEAAVRRFQQAKGIAADSIVGPVTWGKLWEQF